jgi:hypothetical protein
LHKGVDLDLRFLGNSPVYLRGEEGPAREEIFHIITPMRKQRKTLQRRGFRAF